ncbi:putative bifunctional diguanylate cyclase/phosphodiesterase [Salinimonas chungwhensis]|uniref:putative bifunctional diguanylate cyclase/phosphodiesterase n=1 Tax=Salinimonas chungwhensis TaxID=265425 RepID=UPI00146134E9|nr:bifunctional diguanylate cyclase/phosphodiesterase [Salinimonas chungwhensis]
MRSQFFIGYMILSSILFLHDILVVFGFINSVFISLLGVLVLIGYFAIRLIVEHDSMQVKLAELAFKDLQTGLPNRAQMVKSLESEKWLLMERASIAFWIVDIDHFSRYNRTFGRKVGNRILRRIATQLKSVAETHQIKLAKLDIDQFLLVCCGETNNEEFIHQVAISVQYAAQQEIFIDQRDFKPTCTIGMAVLRSEEVREPEELFGFAEQAIAHAKQFSKSNIVRLEESDLHRSRYEQSLMKSLQDALDDFLLQAFFQPQISASGELYGAEVLVRWHSKQGFIPPCDFIPLAEKYGLIHKLGSQILEKSLTAIHKYQNQLLKKDFRLSINVSSWELGRPSYVSDILRLFEKYNVSPALYTLEVTESAMMHDIDKSIEKLLELKQHGFRIALDDFGTGYSSLSYLTKLPLDILKIDKAFVKQMDCEAEVMFVKGIHDISLSCNLVTLVEGIESEFQVNALLAMGIKYFQGYYFSRPLPFEEFESLYLSPSRKAISKL